MTKVLLRRFIMTQKEIKKEDAVNEMLPVSQLAVLGLQHVLAAYAGAVAVH